jgi:hypothetical protein
MSYEIYKVLHLFGLVTLFASLGALTIVPLDRRKPFMMLHGIAAVIMLVAGFGLLARLQLMGSMPGWVHAKIAIWVILGATPVILKKKPNLAFKVLLLSLLLGGAAAFLAIYKPGT